jgi:hypothetical protein
MFFTTKKGMVYFVRKASAYFAIYNVVSIYVFALAVIVQDEGAEIDYLGVATGVYIAIAVVFLLIAISSLAIDEILK